jgi:hypothetical protein
VCAPCREVVALSQPQLPELAIQTVIKPAPVSRWRRLLTPGFGLAASVAAMAIIAVLVLQLPQRVVQPSGQSTQQAKTTAPVDPTAPAEAKEPLAAQPAETRSASADLADKAISGKEAQIETKRAESTRGRTVAGSAAAGSAAAGSAAPPPPAKAPVLIAGLQKKDYVNTNFFAANNGDQAVLDGQGNNDFPSAPQPQAASTHGAFVANNGKITNFSDIPAANADGKSNVRILTPLPLPERCGFPLCKIVEKGRTALHRAPGTGPALSSSTLSFSAMGGPGKFGADLQKSAPAEVAAAPERPEAGSLERSDALSFRALSPSGARLLESAPTLWKVADGKLMKSVGQSQWEDAYPAAGSSFEFSCVNARGTDVWAGGSHASLIHSRDGGLTWESVKLGDATGTIVNIIAGGLSVQVNTSDKQIWSSPDGGKTWTMRSE